MRKFLRMLLAVLFCTTAMCMTDVYADNITSDNVQKSEKQSIQDSVRDVKSTAVNNAFNAYSDEEVYLLAQLVYHEAHNQAYNGKVAIAEVVLNRVNSRLFPNNISDVIFQSGQFTSIRRLKNINPTEQEIRIAFNVLNGSLRVLKDSDVLYFRNPKITSGISSKIEKDWGDKEYYTHIGDHAFYSQEIDSVPAVAPAEKTSLFAKIPSAFGFSKLFKSKTSVAKEETTENEVSDEVTTETPVLNATNPQDLADANDNGVADEEAMLLNNELVEAIEGEQNELTEEQLMAIALQNALVLNDKADEQLAENEEMLSVENAVLMAQANPLQIVVEKEESDKSAVEEELDDFDENDPVAIARRRALMDEKAEVERKAREVEEQIKANELAQEQAKLLDQMHVEKIARYNAECQRATQAAVAAAKANEGK